MEWQTESFSAQSAAKVNKMQVVLFQDGRIQVNYGVFADPAASDAGSGLSKGDGIEVLNVSQLYGPVPSLQGRSFLIEKFVPQLFDVDTINVPVTSGAYTVEGNRYSGAAIAATADTSATIGAVSYPTATRWQFEVQQLVEGDNTLLVTMTPATGDPVEESATVVYESGVAVYGVDDYANPGNQPNLVLSGTRETGAIIVATNLADSQLATVSYPTSRSWAASFTALPDGLHNTSLHVTDAFSNIASETLMVTIDTLPPAIAMDGVTGPVGESSVTVTGTMEEGASVAVTADTTATVGAVTYSGTTWSVAVSGLEEGANVITATAEDGAGNAGIATLTLTYVAPPVIAISPNSIDEDYCGPLQLSVSGLYSPGAAVRIEQVVDADQDGLAGPGEPVIRSFELTDGNASANPNVQGDEDGLVDGTITTSLNFYNPLDRPHAAGHTVFRVVGAYGSTVTPLVVSAVPQAQSIAGTIGNGMSLMPGGLATLVDKWGREITHVQADDMGHYVLNVPVPGEYYLVGWAPGHVVDKSALALVSVGSNENLSGLNIQVMAGSHLVTGQVTDEVTGVGIVGIRVTAENAHYEGSGLTDATGAFELLLPAGDYLLRADVAAAAAQGYVGLGAGGNAISVSGELTDIELPLAPAEVLVSGRVLDDLGDPVVGMPVLGLLDPAENDDELLAAAVTDGNGHYSLGLLDGENWRIILDDQAAQVRGYLGSRIADFSTTSDSPTGNDLTATPVSSWVEGRVLENSLAPVLGVPVELQNASGEIGAAMTTATDGTYRLGAPAGSWLVQAHPELFGFGTVAEQGVSLAAGETRTVDFTVGSPQSNTIVITNARYHTRKHELTVTAVSQYGAEADLELVGYGPMVWRAKKGCWKFKSSTVRQTPETVTVSGPEGSRAVTVKVKGPKAKRRFEKKSQKDKPRFLQRKDLSRNSRQSFLTRYGRNVFQDSLGKKVKSHK